MAPQKAFLVDGTAFCYRAFYAIRNLSTSDGRPTNAVYGFAVMLQALQQKEHPDYLAVAFDAGKPTFRHRRFEAYKEHRKPMPDALIQQLPLIKALLAAYRIPVFEREGYEAEDLLASMAKRIAGGRVEVFLVTGDKDALQLINSHIKVYNPHKEHAVLDGESVRARYGVAPGQLVDLMALMGDAVDNIPNVPGIGEKTAVQLIQRFGTLEALYRKLGEVDSAAQRQSLQAAREQVELSKELARIDPDVPIDVSLDQLRPHEPDWPALRRLFRDLQFKRLLNAVQDQSPVAPRPTERIRVVDSEAECAALIQRLRQQQAAPGILCWAGQPAVVALASTAEEGWVLRLDEGFVRSAAGNQLAAWLADASAPKIGHNAKAAKRFLRRAGLALEGISGDTMIAAYLVNPSRTHEAVGDLCEEYLDQRLPPVPREPIPPLAAPLEPFGAYACAVVRLHSVLSGRLDADGLTALYRELELPLMHVLAEMERTGIAVDVPYLNGLRAAMATDLSRLTRELYELAGCEFNLNSPKQLAQVLFERLALPVVKRTKTGPSTDSDVLNQLAQQHALPQRLLQYRELTKLVSTYVDALPELVDPATGRVHTSFNQTATATGRLSSSEPNLQNIPIKTELGRSIRKAFIPGLKSGILVAADYSQIELRILAHCSGDEQLVSAFQHDRDIHRVTASLIYGIPEAEVQPEQRYAIKAVNFGIVYGMSAHGLSRELGVSFEDAQAFIDAYFKRYPKVRTYLDAQIAQARREGFVQTLLGRRRYIPEVNSPDGATRQFGERMAVNAPIQGSAADLIKHAMVQLAERLTRERLQARLLLQVHDELVLECPREELGTLAAIVRRTMEAAIALAVPLKVTLKSGPNWLELTPVE